MLLRRLTVVALALFAVACADDRPVLRLGTEGTSFQRELVPTTSVSPVAFVPFNTWNRGNATAFIPACGTRASAVVDRYVGGSWEQYSSLLCLDVTTETPIELRAGASRRDEVAIGEAGHFRIRVSYSSDASARHGFTAISRDFDVH